MYAVNTLLQRPANLETHIQFAFVLRLITLTSILNQLKSEVDLADTRHRRMAIDSHSLSDFLQRSACKCGNSVWSPPAADCSPIQPHLRYKP